MDHKPADRVINLVEYAARRREEEDREETASRLREVALDHAITRVQEHSRAEQKRQSDVLAAGRPDTGPSWWATQAMIAHRLGVSTHAVIKAARTLGLRDGMHEHREERVVVTRRYDEQAQALLDEHIIRQETYRYAAAQAIGFRVAEHLFVRGFQSSAGVSELRAATREYLVARDYEKPDIYLGQVVDEVREALARLEG